jgi:hypothetical protein
MLSLLSLTKTLFKCPIQAEIFTFFLSWVIPHKVLLNSLLERLNVSRYL